MKKKWVLILFFIINFSKTKSQSIPIYYNPIDSTKLIYAGYYASMEPKIVAQDMANLLQKATGKSYTIREFDKMSTKGIFLLLDSTKKYPAHESAIINCNGKDILTITSRYINGLSYGVYTYLDKLGFKFYLPTNDWIKIPQITTAFLKPIVNEIYKPFFKNRYYSVSGDMQVIPGLDETKKNLSAWYTWYRRNRMGSEFLILNGHIGEVFNITHQKEIEADPTILAPVNGKRVFDVSGKLDPTNKKGVDMFVDWALNQYKIYYPQFSPYLPPYAFQSVDMGDGLNYCHTPACESKFKTVSNQTFYIANEAAKKIKLMYKNAGVNVYAYTERADTPSINIEPNINISIVASAFQNETTPMGLIERWAKKVKSFAVYDYINIDQWNRGNPFFDFNSSFEFLNFLKSKKTDGITYEAGASLFGSGFPNYFTLKYLNTPYDNLSSEFEVMCKDLFGEAYLPISKLFKEWYFSSAHLNTSNASITFTEDELARFVNYLEEADKLAKREVEKNRLLQLKGYIVYLSKYYDLIGNKLQFYNSIKDPQVFDKKVEDLITYTWNLYPTLLFHNSQLSESLKGLYYNTSLTAKWDYYNRNNKLFLTSLQTDANIVIKKEYVLVLQKYLHKQNNYFLPDEVFMQNAAALTADSILINMIDVEAYQNFRYPLNIYCPAPSLLSIHYKVAKTNNTVATKNNGYIALQKNDYTFKSENVIAFGKKNGTININLPTKGYYKIFLAQQNESTINFVIRPGKNLMYLNATQVPPNGIVLQQEKETTYDNRYLALYCPNTVDSFYYTHASPECVDFTTFYNFKGKEFFRNTNETPTHVSIKPSIADKTNFIYFTNNFYSWQPSFKNLPPYIFFLKRPIGVNK